MIQFVKMPASKSLETKTRQKLNKLYEGTVKSPGSMSSSKRKTILLPEVIFAEWNSVYRALKFMLLQMKSTFG